MIRLSLDDPPDGCGERLHPLRARRRRRLRGCLMVAILLGVMPPASVIADEPRHLPGSWQPPRPAENALTPKIIDLPPVRSADHGTGDASNLTLSLPPTWERLAQRPDGKPPRAAPPDTSPRKAGSRVPSNEAIGLPGEAIVPLPLEAGGADGWVGRDAEPLPSPRQLYGRSPNDSGQIVPLPAEEEFGQSPSPETAPEPNDLPPSDSPLEHTAVPEQSNPTEPAGPQPPWESDDGANLFDLPYGQLPLPGDRAGGLSPGGGVTASQALNLAARSFPPRQLPTAADAINAATVPPAGRFSELLDSVAAAHNRDAASHVPPPAAPAIPWWQLPSAGGEGLPPQDLVPGGIPCGQHVPFSPDDFAQTAVHAVPAGDDPLEQLQPYRGKHAVPTQRPPIELWRPFYGPGIFSPAIPVFSDVNPLQPQLVVFGDYRSGVGVHRIGSQDRRAWASAVQLFGDLRLTGTERFHALMQPLDHNGRFNRLDFSDLDDVRFEREMDAQLDVGFFEGDLGAMYGSIIGDDAPFDLPIAVGLMPLVYQNGIWMEDAAAGVAISSPWRHSRPFNWSNFDATAFAMLDQLTSPAFGPSNTAAQAFGTAWFIEAYEGYIEADWAYVHHRQDDRLSYYNSAVSYTRRYAQFLSNSVRLIHNAGQDGLGADRTADGTLLLVENLFLASPAATFVPYCNLFYGMDRPQSVARAIGSGGILRNTGILFESDNLTGYPTLDAAAADSYGAAVGLNLLTADFRRQIVLEAAALDGYGSSHRTGDRQYGVGCRFQQAITNWTIIRADAMYGWLADRPDLVGSRFEWRWKF